MAGLARDEVGRLWRHYGALLVRRARLITRDAAMADDATQEVFTALMHRGESLTQAAEPYRWLARAVERASLDQLRRGKRLRAAAPLDELETVGAHPGVPIELRNAVLRLLDGLDETRQRVAILAFVDGLTQAEIGEELGLSRVTINKRVQELRAQAEQALRDSNGRLAVATS